MKSGLTARTAALSCLMLNYSETSMTIDLQNQDNQEKQANEQPTPETTDSSKQEETQTPQQDTSTPEATGQNEEPRAAATEETPSVPEEQPVTPPEQPAAEEQKETPTAATSEVTPDVTPANEAATPDESAAPEQPAQHEQPTVAEEQKAPTPPAEASTAAQEVKEQLMASPEATESKPDDDAAADAPKEEKAEEEKANRLSDEEAQPIWDELTKALEDSAIITATCERSISGGAIVSYKGIEGFVPKSQFSGAKNINQSEIDSQKGQEMEIMVIELSGFEKRRFVASRKKALKEKRYAELNVNDIVEGTVTSLTDYGAFVSLGGGIDGLIHISRMSKAHVDKPSDKLSVNENVKVRIVDINKEKDRVSLSMKEFTESPWAKIDDKLKVGEIVTGKVRSLTDFGAYVKLDQDFSGLVHISDLSWTKRVEHPSEVVKAGEEIKVKITDINRKKRRISLSLREAMDDPWPKLANIYTVGSTVEGRIKRLFEPGMIVELDQDVDCFVPRGRMGARKSKSDEPTHKLGDSIQLKVIEIDPDKRTLVCGLPREDRPPSDRRRERNEEIPQQFKAGGTSNEDRSYSFGELADLDKLVFASGENKEEATPATEEAPKSEAPEAVPTTEAAVTPETAPEPVEEKPAEELSAEAAPEAPAAMPVDPQPAAPETPSVDEAVEQKMEEQTETPAEEKPTEDATSMDEATDTDDKKE